MEVFRAYAYATSASLALQSLPLLLAPRAILLLTSPPPPDASPSAGLYLPPPTTDVERHLSRSLGLTSLALAVLVVLLTGAIPLHRPNRPSSPFENGSTGINDDAISLAPSMLSALTCEEPESVAAAATEAERAALASPYVQATLVVTTTYHACTAFHLYTRLTAVAGAVLVAPATFALAAGWAVSGGLGAVGLWVLVFGGEYARIGRAKRKGSAEKAGGDLGVGMEMDRRTVTIRAPPSEIGSVISSSGTVKEREHRSERGERSDRSERGERSEKKRDKEKEKEKERSGRRSILRTKSR